MQTHRIPTYLIAFAVGALVSKEIGPRTSVWCEEEVLEAAAYEFEETEGLLALAEELCGPYVWCGVFVLFLCCGLWSLPGPVSAFLVCVGVPRRRAGGGGAPGRPPVR